MFAVLKVVAISTFLIFLLVVSKALDFLGVGAGLFPDIVRGIPGEALAGAACIFGLWVALKTRWVKSAASGLRARSLNMRSLPVRLVFVGFGLGIAFTLGTLFNGNERPEVPPTPTRMLPTPTPVTRINNELVAEMRTTFYSYAYTVSASAEFRELLPKLHDHTDTLFWLWYPDSFDTYKRALETQTYSLVTDEYHLFLVEYFEGSGRWESGSSFNERIRELADLLVLVQATDAQSQHLAVSSHARTLAPWALALFGGRYPYSERHLYDLIIIISTNGGIGFYSQLIHNALDQQWTYHKNMGTPPAAIFRTMVKDLLKDRE